MAEHFVGAEPVCGVCHSRIESSRFVAPPVVADDRKASVNALGYHRVMFAADDIDETLGRLRDRGTTRRVSAQIVGVSGSTGDP